jgi:hypothetical protein
LPETYGDRFQQTAPSQQEGNHRHNAQIVTLPTLALLRGTKAGYGVPYLHTPSSCTVSNGACIACPPTTHQSTHTPITHARMRVPVASEQRQASHAHRHTKTPSAASSSHQAHEVRHRKRLRHAGRAPDRDAGTHARRGEGREAATQRRTTRPGDPGIAVVAAVSRMDGGTPRAGRRRTARN